MNSNRIDKDLIGRFHRNERGTIALIFALSVVVLMGVVGLAVDGARAYRLTSRITSMLDAAALAAGSMLDEEDYTDAEIQARALSYFNVNWNAQGDVVLSPPTTNVDRAQFEVKVAVTAQIKTLLGSVVGVDQINVQREATVIYRNKKVELALVLDVTGSMCDPCDKIDSLKVAAKAVIDTLLDGSHPSSTMKVALAPYAASLNAGALAAAVTGNASTDSCVVERSGADAFTDALATGGRRLNAITTVPANGNYSCPAASIMPLSEDRALLRSMIDSLATGGGTAGHIGAAWGWYLVSPEWSSMFSRGSKPRSYSDKSTIKAVLLMSDGMFNTSYLAAGQNSDDRLVVGSAPDQALRLCDAMKAKGVTVYTVAFQAPPGAEDLLRDCATGAGHFFAVADPAALTTAFTEVARRLTALRISQ